MEVLTRFDNFVGRERELDLLDDLWADPRATLFIMYGRRRVGKTRLLTHWQNGHAADALYWVAEPTSPRNQLSSLAQALYRFEFPEREGVGGYNFLNWEEIFNYMGEITSKRRVAIFLDEFTYLMDAEPEIVGTLQKVWDQRLKQTNLKLALSGSNLKLMQEKLIDYQAPLYGRATQIQDLRPLPFGITREYFPNLTPEQRIEIFSMVGGVPAYWERFNPDAPIEQNLLSALIKSPFMREEPITLLRDHVDQPYNYTGILQAISSGCKTTGEVTKAIGMARTTLPKYLQVLRKAGFIENRWSATAPNNKRKVRIKVSDPFIRFYFANISSRVSDIEVGGRGLEKTVRNIIEKLPEYIGKNTWPELCREWLASKSAFEEIPVDFDQLGEAWKGQTKFDVVGINFDEQIAYLGLCFWDDRPTMGADFSQLAKMATAILPTEQDWTVVFMAFSKKGFAEDAESFVQEVRSGSISGKNWQANDLLLVDFETVDADLARFTD